MFTKKSYCFLFVIIAFIYSVLNLQCTSSKYNPYDQTTWEWFRIDAKVIDDPVFEKLQKELGIDPLLATYTVVVNIENKGKEYVLIGDEGEAGTVKFKWSTLSKDVQDKLINWKGINKEALSKRK